MATETPLETVQTLHDEITEIKKTLETILAGGIDSATEDLEPFQKAKLHATLAFAIHDLSYIYLKMNGQNPADHQVTAELGRVKGRFSKLHKIEHGPEKRTMQLDKQATSRFIKHGLSQNRIQKQKQTEMQKAEET